MATVQGQEGESGYILFQGSYTIYEVVYFLKVDYIYYKPFVVK